ncbi:hyoscyamine 6-dioxygenase-like [Salvia divinorum]|uniref:Hyoscyamine 6-dioxygenase-like n=1 Tax=Salvia divinorum TaxID=28513 RepID=A0ABD1FYI7_SALDI
MEALMSNWLNPVETVPEKYIFPADKRPGSHAFPVMHDIPLIDLQNPNPQHITQQIIDASQRFGIFQVINHGIPASLMEETMAVMKGFFAGPAEYKASLYSTDIAKICRIYSSTLNYDSEDVHYWRDNLTHHCHPLQDHIHLWPQHPPTYRQVVGAYAVETRKLMVRILEAMCEGLGLKPDYLEGEMTKTQLISVNHHIPCPDPTLTLGMPQHTDPNLITVLQQCSVPGLQVLRHRQWMDVPPNPAAFLVVPGLQLKVMSNGKFWSPIHRVMTHRGEARTTIGTFLIPSNEIVIEPADDRPAVYRGFTYGEFFSCFTRSNCDADTALAFFQTNSESTSLSHV